MQIDTTKAGCSIEELNAVAGKRFGDWICIFLLPRKAEPSHNTGVLIKTGAWREAAQRGFDATNPNVKVFIRPALCIDSNER